MKNLNHALVAAVRGASGSRVRLTNGLSAPQKLDVAGRPINSHRPGMAAPAAMDD